jgi:hypothetical protein
VKNNPISTSQILSNIKNLPNISLSNKINHTQAPHHLQENIPALNLENQLSIIKAKDYARK